MLKARRRLAACSAALAIAFAASCSTLRAQSNQASRLPGEPPKILNIVHEQLIPGKAGAYAELLKRIGEEYSRRGIPVYWYGAQSFTGPLGALYLNFFESFAEMHAANDTLNKSVAANPALAQMQEQLLTYTSSVSNAFAVRRDDLGYRWDAIDFSNARVLRVATIAVRQGHETEFAEAIRGLRAAYARLNANAYWATYQVTAGAPSSTFVIFLPMGSLDEMDDYINRLAALPEAEGPGVAGQLQQIARDAYRSWDSELFIVSPSQSRMPADFTAGDSAFWGTARP